MSDAVSLAARRVRNSGDCREWSVVECLEDTLAQAREGRWTKCVVLLYGEGEEDTFNVDTRSAGCTKLEARGLLLTEMMSD